MTVERSSPLAAIQPSGGLPYWNRHVPRPGFDAEFLRPLPYQPINFNFRDLSMRNSKPLVNDYFSRPVRGSSPTASLAADLSQNCHIDLSPQLDTPRRSLFVSVGHGGPGQEVVTPPVPSSSPGLETDPMEMSPLPHKVPSHVVRAAEMGLPTPDPTPVPELVEQSGALVLDRQFELMNPPVLQPIPASRKTSLGSRPALFRKGFSMSAATTSQTSIPTPAEQPFIFGPGHMGAAIKPSLESFAESPPSERKLPASSSTSSLVSNSFNPSVSGSPVAVPRRPPTARAARPNGFARRTQSMQYSNPIKPMREGKRSCTTGLVIPAQPEVEDNYNPKLPNFKHADHQDGIPRISIETLVNLQNGVYSSDITEFTIVDCRFEYEYEGGHIDGALNFNDKEQLSKHLFGAAPQPCTKKALILHCEYSECRAPQAARHIRTCDRDYNAESYPNLTYPEMYILQGGYQAFFKQFRDRCFPQSYTQMLSAGNEEACDRGMAKVRQRRKLSRAQTYAFGQHEISTSHELPGPKSLSAGAVPPESPFGCLGFQDVDAMDIDTTSTLLRPGRRSSDTISPPPMPRRLGSY